MSEPTYLIAFDIVDSDLNLKAVKEHIRTNSDFTHWWNYLPGVYLVTTKLDPEEITERIHRIWEGATFLVIRVYPEDSQGWLPEKSWGWIKKRAAERNDLVAKPT